MLKKLLVILFCLLSVNSFADDEITIDGGSDVYVGKRSALFYEKATNPGSPSVNGLKLFAKDKTGITTLYTKDSAGTVTEVGAGGSMTWPTGAGIAVYSGSSSWGISLTDNHTNWDTAYTDRLKWDGGATGLVAATGRTSLGLGTAALSASTDFLGATAKAADSDLLDNHDTSYFQIAGNYQETLTNSAGLLAALNDETGTGLAVFSTSPTFTTQITTPKIVSTGDMTFDAVNAAANSTIYILNSDGTYTADLNVEGNLVVTDVTVSTGGTLQLGQNGTDGILKIYSEQGATDYIASLYANTAMTSAASFYLPADEPAAESFLKMGTDGIIDYDTTVLGSIATQAANNVSISGGSITGITDLAVADGGTGKSSWTQYLIPYADTTTSFSQIAIGTSGQVLTSNGAGAAPTFQAASGGGVAISKVITQNSHGFVVGDVLKFIGGVYAKAMADSATNAEVVGIVSTKDTNTFTLLYGGYIDTLSSLTASSVYFLSPTSAGALTITEPTAVDQVSKPLLFTVSATAGYFFNYRGLSRGIKSKSFIITNPTITADGSVWRTPEDITIIAVHLLCKGNVVVGNLTEQDANGLNDAGVDGATDITGVVDTNVNDDGSLSNPSIDAGDYIGWRTTSVTGAPTKAIIVFDYI